MSITNHGSILLGFFFLLSPSVVSSQDAGSHSEAIKLLKSCTESQSVLNRASWDLSVLAKYPAFGKNSAQSDERYEIHVTRDIDRLSLRGRNLFPKQIEAQFITLDNGTFFFSTQFPLSQKLPNSGLVSENEKLRRGYLDFHAHAPQSGGGLDGHVSFFGGRSVTEDLLSADDLRVGGSEIVGGINCQVVEGRTPNGRAKVWLALSKRNSLLKFRLERDDVEITRNAQEATKTAIFGPNFETGNPLPPLSLIDTLDLVKLDLIEDHYIPVEGIHTYQCFRGGVASFEQVSTIKRSNFHLGLTPEDQDAFKIELKDHAFVRFLDVPKSGVIHEWVGGRVSTLPGQRPTGPDRPFEAGNSRIWFLISLNLVLIGIVALVFYFRRRRRGVSGTSSNTGSRKD